jgi:hypothetical protein
MSELFEIVDATGDENYTLGVFPSFEAAFSAILDAAGSVDTSHGGLPSCLDPFGVLDSEVTLAVIRRKAVGWSTHIEVVRTLRFCVVLKDDGETYRVDLKGPE